MTHNLSYYFNSLLLPYKMNFWQFDDALLDDVLLVYAILAISAKGVISSSQFSLTTMHLNSIHCYVWTKD